MVHFEIAEKPTIDYTSPYNNAGLISEKIGTETLKIAVLHNHTVV